MAATPMTRGQSATRAAPVIGVDLGGTKIEAVRLDAAGDVVARDRIPSPRGDYDLTIAAIRDIVAAVEPPAGDPLPVGIGVPGSVSKRTGRCHNANSAWLNGRDLAGDLYAALQRPVSIANDADCFALSEAVDGAGAGSRIVLGVILGTGAGSGLAIDGRIFEGRLGIAGEWGHNPLPRPTADELPGPGCWCGRSGCLEAWVSGPGLAADAARACNGATQSVEAVVQAAEAGDARAIATLDRHADRLARGLSHVVNIVDPDIIVLGGGLSKLAHLYETLPRLMRPHIFADDPVVTVAPPKWGDASGVRGAAWLAQTWRDRVPER